MGLVEVTLEDMDGSVWGGSGGYEGGLVEVGVKDMVRDLVRVGVEDMKGGLVGMGVKVRERNASHWNRH